jgi:hypothetical protein
MTVHPHEPVAGPPRPPNRRFRRRYLAATGLTVAALGATALTITSANPALAESGCEVDYTVVNDWGSGFQANITISADEPINGWQLEWDFPSGTTVSSAWNVDWNQSGTTFTGTDIGWNGSIDSGQSREVFGFAGNGSSATPDRFTLNGDTCNDSDEPSGEPSTDPTGEPSQGYGRYEAEEAPAACQGTIDSDNAGYSGSGFCNTDNATGASAQFTVDVPSAGSAILGLRYANGADANRSADVAVNDSAVRTVPFASTGAWTAWTTQSVTVDLVQGENTIDITATGSDGLANLDYLEVSPDDGSNEGECGAGSPDATVTGASGNYTARNGGSTLYQGGDYRSAIQSAVDSISAGERVAVMADGAIGSSTISIPSGRIFEGCGTIDADNRRGRGAIESLNTSNVSIPYLNITGDPYFATRFYGNSNLHLGEINLNQSGGAGIRFERDYAGSSDVTIDYVYVSGTSGHGVETWNIDGLEVGTVMARNTGYAGILLNNTRNAHIELVDGDDVATGTGYATFRTANTAGRLADGSYRTNIYVDKVVSRGGGRGIFCVSRSGGVHIGEVDLAGNGNNAVLLENCYNYTIASGTVNGGGEVRIAARSEFPNTRDTNITLRVDDTSVRESPCADNSTWNIAGNASVDIC